MFSAPYKAVSCSPNMTWISKMSTLCSKPLPSNLNTSLLFSARKSTVSSDIVIREATVSDYAAVVDLIDEDGVHDYLPALYKQQVSDPDNFPHVATIGGRVVAYAMGSALDMGETRLLRSGRVHKSFRNMGILRAMFDFFYGCSSHMPLRVYDMLSITDREDSVFGGLLAAGYRPVMRREGLQTSYQTPKTSPTGTGEDNSIKRIELKELSRSDLQRIVQDHNLCRVLFPQGRLYNWYVGYRLMEENIRHLMTPWSGAFASFQDTRALILSLSGDYPGQRDFPQSDIILSSGGASPSSGISHQMDQTNRLDSSVSMVTFYNCYPTRYGGFYSLDAYATQGVSKSHFQAHLRKNVDNIDSRFPGQKVALAVTFDTAVSKECVTSCLFEQGISEMLPRQEKWQLLYERMVKK